MSNITFMGNAVETSGSFPQVGDSLKDFNLVNEDLGLTSPKNFAGKKIILNIFPSLDTDTCATSVRKFNEIASKQKDTVVLCISKDLPFAQGRFCGAEGLDNVITLSEFRNNDFSENYGVLISNDSPLKGLMTRSVIVADESGKVIYSEVVPEITNEPDYDKALAVL